ITADNLAQTHWALREFEQAAPLMRQILDSTNSNLESTASFQSERQQLATVRSLRSRLDDYLSLTQHLGQTATDAYSYVLAWKGSVLARQRRQNLLRQNTKLHSRGDVVDVLRKEDGSQMLLFKAEDSRFEDLQSVSARLASLTFAAATPEQSAERAN